MNNSRYEYKKKIEKPKLHPAKEFSLYIGMIILIGGSIIGILTANIQSPFKEIAVALAILAITIGYAEFRIKLHEWNKH